MYIIAILLVTLLLTFFIVRRRRSRTEKDVTEEDEEEKEMAGPGPGNPIGSKVYALLKRVGKVGEGALSGRGPYGGIRGRAAKIKADDEEAPPLIDPYTKFKQQLLEGGFIDADDLEAGILEDEEVAAEIARLLDLSKDEGAAPSEEMPPEEKEATTPKEDKAPPVKATTGPEGERPPEKALTPEKRPESTQPAVYKEDILEQHLRDEEALKRQLQALDALLKGQRRPETGPERPAKTTLKERPETGSPATPPEKKTGPGTGAKPREPTKDDDIEDKLKWLDDTLKSHKDADDE
ncbi:MAG: hypothetical protein QGG50_06775 [Methanopyri archaeon]|jgi:hypothetical protein|nr:hypothetical protein [Methanopyri archaeon]